MYYESVFSLRQASSKLCSAPIISCLSFQKHDVEDKYPHKQCWTPYLLKFLSIFQKLCFKLPTDNVINSCRGGYGHVLMKHFCAIDPVDSGAEFHEDALEDRPRFVYGYRRDPIFYYITILLHILSGGLLWIFFHWFPLWKFVLGHYPCNLVDATHVVIRTQKGEEHVASVFRPAVVPSEACHFDNWPALCGTCHLKKKCHVTGGWGSYSYLEEGLLKNYYNARCDDDKRVEPQAHEQKDHLSEIYTEEWCACPRAVCCNLSDDLHVHLFMFRFRLLRYYLNLRENVFDIVHFHTQLNPVVLHKTLGQGITSREVYASRQRIFGMDTAQRYPLWKVILEELTEPFYVFQLLSVALWIWNEYLEYAYVVMILMAGSTVYDISIARECERRILQLGLDLSFRVNVFRNWEENFDYESLNLQFSAHLYENDHLLRRGLKSVDAGSLQPGDVFEIENGMILPCDTVLLWGHVVVSETVLSGEAIPQTKTPLPGAYHEPRLSENFGTADFKSNTAAFLADDASRCCVQHTYHIDRDTRHTLYAGTRVLTLQPLPAGQRVMGLCARTRFLSSHGRLLRSSLFPKGPFFDFNAQALQFFGYMCWVCMVGALISVVTGLKFHFDTTVIIIRTLDLFTDALPPALPAVLGMGIVVSMRHLRTQHGINCIHAGRINLAGLVDTFVFDKTGTLTEQGLTFNGCVQVHTALSRLEPPKWGIPHHFYSNMFWRQSTCFRKQERFNKQSHLIKALYKGKRAITSPISLSGTHGLASPAVVDNRPSSTPHLGTRQMRPDTLKRHLLEALATCHSLSLVDGELVGDPLDLSLVRFTRWKIHDIQEDIDEVKQFQDVLRHSVHEAHAVPAYVHRLLQQSPLQIVITQLSCLYKAYRTLPTIMKPPHASMCLLQQRRRAHPFFGLQRSLNTTDDVSKLSSCVMFETPQYANETPASPLPKQAKFNELGVVRRFDFSSTLQRLTVIVRDPITHNVYAYSKGSPEIMATLCTTTSLPPTFYSTIAHYTQAGNRVIIIGGKYLGKIPERVINYLSRRKVERKLTLLGFALFSNRLKPDTQRTIQQLNEAHCRCIIATGDNPLTALSVAKACEIIRNTKRAKKEIILGDLYIPSEHNNKIIDGSSFFIWTKVEKFSRDHYPKKRLPHRRWLKHSKDMLCTDALRDPHMAIYSSLKKQWNKRVTLDLKDFLRGKNPRQFEFIITGRAFRKLRMMHEELQLRWFDEPALGASSLRRGLERPQHQAATVFTQLNRSFCHVLDYFGLRGIPFLTQDSLQPAWSFKDEQPFGDDTRSNHRGQCERALTQSSYTQRAICPEYRDALDVSAVSSAYQKESPGHYTLWPPCAVVARSVDIGQVRLKPCDFVNYVRFLFHSRLQANSIVYPRKSNERVIALRSSMGSKPAHLTLAKFKPLTLQMPCTIFNRTGGIVPLKSGRLQRYCLKYHMSVSSMVYASILATGKHPKILSNKITCYSTSNAMLSLDDILSFFFDPIVDGYHPHGGGHVFLGNHNDLHAPLKKDFLLSNNGNKTHKGAHCTRVHATPRSRSSPGGHYAVNLRDMVVAFNVKEKRCEMFRMTSADVQKRDLFSTSSLNIKKQGVHSPDAFRSYDPLLPSTFSSPSPEVPSTPYIMLNDAAQGIESHHLPWGSCTQSIATLSRLLRASLTSMAYLLCPWSDEPPNAPYIKAPSLNRLDIPLIDDVPYTIPTAYHHRRFYKSSHSSSTATLTAPLSHNMLLGEHRVGVHSMVGDHSSAILNVDSSRLASTTRYGAEDLRKPLVFPQRATLYAKKTSVERSTWGYTDNLHSSHVDVRIVPPQHVTDTALNNNVSLSSQSHSLTVNNGPEQQTDAPMVNQCNQTIYTRHPLSSVPCGLCDIQASQYIYLPSHRLPKSSFMPSNTRHLPNIPRCSCHYPIHPQSGSSFPTLMDPNTRSETSDNDLIMLSVVVARKQHRNNKQENSTQPRTSTYIPQNSFFVSHVSSEDTASLYQQGICNPSVKNCAQQHTLTTIHGEKCTEDTDYQLIRISLFEYLLRNTRIYARMVPEDKTSLITALRSLPHALAVGMCGDSANDSGALQVADIGISLNDEETSVAASFMAKTGSIHSCRTSLENALQMFTFIVLYSLIQYVSVIVLYVYGLNFSDNQYLFVDFLVILPLSTLLSGSHHSTTLKASLPTVNLFSKRFVVPIVLHMTIAITCMGSLLVFLRFTPGWTPFFVTSAAGDSDGAEVASYETTALFYFTNFLYPLISIAAVAQNRWREERFRHWTFIFSHGLLFFVFFAVIFIPRPDTIPIPSAKNPSPVPLPIPSVEKIGYIPYLLVLIDQTLVLTWLPYQAKLLIIILVIMFTVSVACVQFFILEPYRKQEEYELHCRRDTNRGPIPFESYQEDIHVYHVL